MNRKCFIIATSWDTRPVSLHFRALANELASRGHQVILLISGNTSEVQLSDDNPSVKIWPSRRPTKFRDAYFLYKTIKKYQPDCLIANFGACNVMMLVGWLMGVTSRISWYHTLSSQVDSDARIAPYKMALLRLRKKLVYKVVTQIVANSKAAYEDVQKVFKVPESKCHIFFNSISDPLETFSLSSVEKSGRIVCVGRLNYSKGQDVLIRAASLVKNRFPDLQIEFVGIGSEKDACVSLANELGLSDNCIFSGASSHEDVLKKMAGAIVTVVPSRHEAFGLVNIESLAVGTPVIASNVDGIVEIIRDGIDGYLVLPDNPNLLAEKLIAVISNSELRNNLGANGRQQFLACFEQKGIVNKQIEWLEKILNQKNRLPAYVSRTNKGAAS